MSFSIVVATSKNGMIGINNELPWHLPEDLKNFKKQTTGKTIIMGRKTFESIGKPLPNRNNVILTRNSNYQPDGAIVYTDINNLINSLDPNQEIMIIGGGEIYKLFLPYTDKIYHTLIDANVKGDTTFFVPNTFKVFDEVEHYDGVVNGIQKVKYSFRVLKKRGPRDPFWNKNGYCEDCGGNVEYNYALNTIYCDTCENEITEWM